MYRFLLLSVALVSVQAFSLEKTLKCGRFLQYHGLSCCKKSYHLFENMENKEECFKLPMTLASCERQMCLAKKGGFALEGDKVDRAALEKLLEKELQTDQDILNKLKENCINGDMDMYGSSEFCELTKMKACIDVMLIKECPEWDSNDQCSGAEEDAKECLKAFM